VLALALVAQMVHLLQMACCLFLAAAAAAGSSMSSSSSSNGGSSMSSSTAATMQEEAARVPHVSAGWGCKMGQQNATEYLDYKWDLLDSIHYHDAVGLLQNGTTGFFNGCEYPTGAQFRGLKAVAKAHGVEVWLSTANSGFGARRFALPRTGAFTRARTRTNECWLAKPHAREKAV